MGKEFMRVHNVASVPAEIERYFVFCKHCICLRSQIYCVAINNIKINYFIVLNTIIVQIIFIVIINIIMILHHVMLLKMNSRRIAINTVILVLRRFFLRFGGVLILLCFIIFAIS